MGFIFWIVFFVVIAIFLTLDLAMFHRKKSMKFREALLWSSFWISSALLFNAGIYFFYESGEKAALEFLTGYILEESLSLDNLFVISLIFSKNQIPMKNQRAVLMWGILGAAFFRGVLIFSGVSLIQKFSWIIYIFGAILLMMGVRALFFRFGHHVSKEHFLIHWASRYFPITEQSQGTRFFVLENGSWMMTPLFLALLQIECADLIFALDSIPAIFAITLDPFIIYTSNIFAILGLRSLYFALASLIRRFRLLKPCMALILAFIGMKILLKDVLFISTMTSLFVILFLLIGSILLSMIFPKRKFPTLPLENEIAYIYTFSLKQARRLVIFIVGTTVLLFGIVLIVFPGPALLVIPLGILILSTEFVWARKFIKNIRKITGS